MSSDCCGADVEVLTEYEGNEVGDGDRARCTKHGCLGTVLESCGNMVVEWDSEKEEE